MTQLDVRLDRMIEVAAELEAPLDHVVKHMGHVCQSDFRMLSDNPSVLPRYTKSSVTP